MKKKLISLALVGVLALGGTSGVFAAANETSYPSTQNTSIAATAKQSQELTPANTKTTISKEQAKQIALGSVENGTFVSIGLNDNDGIIAYGVEIRVGASINDIKVDANTGKILKTDQGNNNGEKHHLEEKSKEKDNDNTDYENDDYTGY